MDEGEQGAVHKAIKDFTAICEQRGDEECLACERPYKELPAVLAPILPRLEDDANWVQMSGHIPGEDGQSSKIWIREWPGASSLSPRGAYPHPQPGRRRGRLA